jgi:DNA-binding transcriptional MerR regulator
MAREFTLDQLAAASEIPARTIRYYIARGLLKGPVKAGRGATYSPEHLARLQQVKRLQMQGRTLGEIEAILTGDAGGPVLPDASPWWRFELAEDVVVMARADISPWRSRVIREAVRELRARLAAPGTQEDGEEDTE